MKFWKYSIIVYIQILRVFVMFSFAYDDCSWLIDAVEKENLSRVASVIVPRGQYFLRIRVMCYNMINSEMLRSLVLTGVNPLIRVETESFGANIHGSQSFSLLLSAVLMETGDQVDCECVNARNQSFGNVRMEKCFCDRTRPSCSQSATNRMTEKGENCCHVVKNCSSLSQLCNPAWFAPLPLPEKVMTLKCDVIDSGIGPYIKSHRFTMHLDGFHVFINNTVVNVLGDIVQQLPVFTSNPLPMYCAPWINPVCIMGSSDMSNKIIYTTSEFETMQFIEIQDEGTVQNICTSKQSSLSLEVKGALSLPDRILINTAAGIFEVRANYKEISGNMRAKVRVLDRCVSHVAGPTQAALHTTNVMAFGDEQDQETVFYASLNEGSSLTFFELKDSDGRNVCNFLRTLIDQGDSSLCQVVTGSFSGARSDSLIILVKLRRSNSDTYHLTSFRASSSGEWRALFHFPTSLESLAEEQDEWQRLKSQLSGSDLGSRSLELSGLSFTAAISDGLFLWGNALLYSPDGGESIHWFKHFPGNSSIIVFTSSPYDGTFAILTDSHEIWVGQLGSPKLQLLKSSMGLWQLNSSSVMSIFFDSVNRLQQLVSDKNATGMTSCISREEVPLASLITRQTFSNKRQENIDAYQITKKITTSCGKEESSAKKPVNAVERSCPFAWIEFEAEHDLLYTRKCFYKFEPSKQFDSGLVHSTATLHDYFTTVEKSISGECSGINRDKIRTTLHLLPKQIYLGRSENYSFAFYLHLDLDIQIDLRTHLWNLGHLQASLRLSDATVLNLTSQRTELIQQKIVKYQVTVQDAGLRFPQHRSGEGLTPASLHILVWNACSYSHGKLGVLQGSYIMTVLLGCPAGQKLVFDPEASKNASGKQHFCLSVDGVPCFLYERDFLPVFNVVDLANGQVSQFNGKYGLKIVGGGPTSQSITDYSEKDQENYNFKTSSTMIIWSPKVKTLGDIPVFSKTTSGLRWLCASQSPCAGVPPKFPGNAEYYFKVEFSNRIVDADSSNCDFTMRFLIRVHGLPPGSLNPSSVVVLSCVGALGTLIFTFFALKRKDAKLWGHLKHFCTALCKWPLMGRDRLRARVTLRRSIRSTRDATDIPMESVTEDSTVAVDGALDSGTNVSIKIRGRTEGNPDRNTTV